MTLNVEYNQLDALLQATINQNGDTADETTGYSPFPGSINALVFATHSYLPVLKRSQGLIPEFVNPKYADVEKCVFKKPTRLECMMQDFPKLYGNKKKRNWVQITLSTENSSFFER